MLFVHQGTISDGERFFARFWPGARAVADFETELYDAFGLERGNFGQVAGPRVWWRSFLAMLRGNFAGRPVGDPWLLPGVFLIRDGRVLREHRSRHAADHPDFARLSQWLGFDEPGREEEPAKSPDL